MATTALSEADKREARRRVDQIDLDGPKHKLVVEDGISLQEADEDEKSYRDFLYMNKVYPNSSLVPTKRIDRMWHQHILDTLSYEGDCQKLFGRFLHHFPYFGLRGADDAQKLSEAFLETRQAFVAELGVDPAIPSSSLHGHL